MILRKILPLVAALAMISIGSTTYANVISFDDPAQAALVGDVVTFDIEMDFINSTVGGSFDVFYDSSLLSFISFEFDAAFTAIIDPAFSVLPDNCLVDGAAISGCSVGDSELNGIAFGNFDGVTGTHIIGTLSFITLDSGVAEITMATNDGPYEGFFSSVDASELVVLYGPGKIHITQVPVPAAVWLMLSGIGLLGGLSRRHS